MKIHPHTIGWLCRDAMSAEEMARHAIARAAEHGKRATLHLCLSTGRVTLAGPDHPEAPNTFVRGVASDSCPAILAEDLQDEGAHAGLLNKIVFKVLSTRRAMTLQRREELLQIVRAMAGKQSVPEIMAATGKSESWVRHFGRVMRVSLTIPGEAERLMHAKAVAMSEVEAGKTYAAAAKVAGVPPGTVWRWANKAA